MKSVRKYEKRILEEIRALPEEALPKILRLIAFVREEFSLPSKQAAQPKAGSKTSHERTRQLLGTSKGNWAQELIAEREDRL